MITIDWALNFYYSIQMNRKADIIKLVICTYLQNITIYIFPNKTDGFNYEPVHEISNNVVCATSKASDQPAHMRSLIRAFLVA